MNLKRSVIWRNVAALLFLGLGIYIILPQIEQFEESLNVLQRLLLWAVILALIAQAMSYVGSGYLLQKSFATIEQYVSLMRGILIVLGAASIALIGGGLIGSSAAIFRWTRTSEHNSGARSFTSVLPPLFNSILLVALAFFGLTYLLFVHNLTTIQIIAFSIALGALTLIILTAVLASRYRDHTAVLVQRTAESIARLRHKPYDPAFTRGGLDGIWAGWDALRKGEWHLVLLGSFLNIGFDILSLFMMFVAAGESINLSVLVTGYALPLLLSRIAFFIPGGVGVVESSMAVIYTGMGVPMSTAAVVILGYRFLSFWIPSLLGFPVAAYLQNRRVR
ncbi:MAG: lysylphosphatidylglycerol synthase transmembrane domain-containing protein [Anaerolineae bacterium]